MTLKDAITSELPNKIKKMRMAKQTADAMLSVVLDGHGGGAPMKGPLPVLLVMLEFKESLVVTVTLSCVFMAVGRSLGDHSRSAKNNASVKTLL